MEAQLQVNTDGKNTQSDTKNFSSKYLSFRLGNEEYALDILKVREIIDPLPITALPKSPEYVMGVINLRGKVIPVMDTRKKFGMQEAENCFRNCIIVVEINRDGVSAEMGIFVDSVSEVLDIVEEDVDDAPGFHEENSSFILGIAKVGDSIKIILDIDRVMNTDELVDVVGKGQGFE